MYETISKRGDIGHYLQMVELELEHSAEISLHVALLFPQQHAPRHRKQSGQLFIQEVYYINTIWNNQNTQSDLLNALTLNFTLNRVPTRAIAFMEVRGGGSDRKI